MLDFKRLFRNKIEEQWTKGNAGNGRSAMPAMEEGRCQQWTKGDAGNERSGFWNARHPGRGEKPFKMKPLRSCHSRKIMRR